MFDSKEISRRAQLRADNIIKQKRQRQNRLKIASSIFGAGVVVASAVIVTNITPVNYDIHETDYIVIEENQIPLAGVQFPVEFESRITPDFRVPDYSNVIFPADTFDVNMLLQNPEDNNCYFSFELILADTDEILYTSDMVAPSEFIESIILSRTLAKGHYKAVLIIYAYESETFEEIDHTEVWFDLIAE